MTEKNTWTANPLAHEPRDIIRILLSVISTGDMTGSSMTTKVGREDMPA